MGEDIKQNPIQTSAEILKKCIRVICLMTSIKMSISEFSKADFVGQYFFNRCTIVSVSTVQIVLIYC